MVTPIEAKWLEIETDGSCKVISFLIVKTLHRVRCLMQKHQASYFLH